MDIDFVPVSEKHLDIYFKWVEKPHVKETWFLEGYASPDYIHEVIKGNGYDFGFIATVDHRPVGYVVYSDLYSYAKLDAAPKGVFTKEPRGSYSFDLFIGEEDCLGRGIGTRIVESFCDKLFDLPSVRRIVIDPSTDNLRAIACYRKVGFKDIGTAHDGVTSVMILEMERPVGVIPTAVSYDFELEPSDDIRLAILRMDQVDQIFKLIDANREHFRQFLPWVDATQSPKDTRVFVQGEIERSLELAGLTLGVHYQGDLVGLVGLNSIDYLNHAAAMGYWITKEFEGNGIMSRSVKALVDFSFKNLGLYRVEARVALTNGASLRLLEACGFSREGELKGACRCGDNYCDCYIYGLTQGNRPSCQGAC